MNKTVCCLTTVDKWNHSKNEGVYLDKSLDSEGFIHCSYPNQLVKVANKHFKGIENVLILCIDSRKLDCEVVEEDLSNLNELYPHIYGSINIEAVTSIINFQSDSYGVFSLPKEMRV